MTQSSPGGSAGSSGPSPSTPTTSTPWGSTSTVPGSSTYGADQPAQGTPTWSARPVEHSHADAPTANVPLVQGTAAATYQGAVPPPPPSPAAADQNRAGRATRARGPRRARLQLRHVNPWTVLKFSCVLSIALFFVWLIVVGILFGVLDAAGVVGKINDAYTTVQGGNAKAPVTAGIVFGGAAIIGVVNIVLFIALSTVGSVVYNLCADLVGGIEITLSER
jgi:Transmembrane domain of unknown function (DUF3566)